MKKIYIYVTVCFHCEIVRSPAPVSTIPTTFVAELKINSSGSLVFTVDVIITAVFASTPSQFVGNIARKSVFQGDELLVDARKVVCYGSCSRPEEKMFGRFFVREEFKEVIII